MTLVCSKGNDFKIGVYGNIHIIESMCLAIRYPLERGRLQFHYSYYHFAYPYLELVEQLHQNITKQQISNLALLQEQQQQMSEGHRQGMASLERINQAQEHLWQQWQLNMMVIERIID